MSFLKCERLAEDLHLDKDVKVSGKIVKYLKDFQIDGIRFLYKHFKKETGCILNDESKLGKCLTVSVFLGCLKPTVRTLIICKNKDKIGLWMFHLEILTAKKTGLDADVGIIDLEAIEDVDPEHWNYVVLDERGSDLFSVNDLRMIERINCSRKLILSTDDIIENLKHFYNVSQFCKRDEFNEMDFSEVKEKYSLPSSCDVNYMRKREKIQNFCRDFRLRRYLRSIKGLPLTEPDEFNKLYEKWMNYKTVEREKQPIPVPVAQTNSSNLFEFQNSGNEATTSKVNSEPLEAVDIFQSFRRKELPSQSSESPPNNFTENPKEDNKNVEESSFELFLSEDEINPSTNESFLNQNVFMVDDDDLFLNNLFEPNSETSTKSSEPIHKLILVDSNKLIESSAEVQIVEEKNSVVILSSSEEQRPRSPDLFSDLENDDVDPRKFSTPINSLLNSHHNQFSPSTNDKTDIFEITENEAFPNVIKINSDTEMSPLRLTESDDEPKPDLSRTIDFNLLYSSVFAENSNLNETIRPQISPVNSFQKTPSPAAEVIIKTTPISATKSKQTTPKGWFTKSSYRDAEDGSSNPKRRRKLELSFKDASLESCKLASQKRRKGRSRIVLSSDDDF